MIGQSDIRPQTFSVIDLTNGMSEIILYTDITEKIIQTVDNEPKTIFEFDMYEMLIQTRSDLTDDINANYESWLSYAKGQSTKPLSDKEKIAMLDQVLTELILGGI